MMLDHGQYTSPLGDMTIAFSTCGLCALCFSESWDRQRCDLRRRLGAVAFRPSPINDELRQHLDAYFAGELGALDEVEADATGTPFQQRVWSELRMVKAGTTTSYEKLATKIGCRHGARAVGAANAANPVALVIPCHRVIRADGDLCGYAGGVERKSWLLRHEGVRYAD
jgi:methylated-DNA-[protein]-cysteine S-methyltransferase